MCLSPHFGCLNAEDTGLADFRYGGERYRVFMHRRFQLEVKPFDAETLKAQFKDKFFLMLLGRRFGIKNESKRRHLLIAYYDETTLHSSSESSPLKRHFEHLLTF